MSCVYHTTLCIQYVMQHIKHYIKRWSGGDSTWPEEDRHPFRTNRDAVPEGLRHMTHNPNRSWIKSHCSSLFLSHKMSSMPRTKSRKCHTEQITCLKATGNGGHVHQWDTYINAVGQSNGGSLIYWAHLNRRGKLQSTRKGSARHGLTNYLVLLQIISHLILQIVMLMQDTWEQAHVRPWILMAS